MPLPRETAEDKKDKSTADRDKARLDQGHCGNCHLEGQLTIFRKPSPGCAGYTGDPTCELIDHNGEVRRVLARMSCHCACKVGDWMRSNCSDDICLRIPKLSRVGIKGLGMENWTQHDPTIPQATGDALPDWKAFRRMIANGPAVAKSARALLRERAPAPGWKSLPPTPNVPAPPVAAEVPEEELCDIPF